MVNVGVVNENSTIVVANLEMEPICGDICSWCGECVVCAETPIHASPWRLAHVHYINYTEQEALQRGLEWK